MNPTEDDDDVIHTVTRLDVTLEIRGIDSGGLGLDFVEVTGPGEHGRRAFHISPEKAAEMIGKAEGVTLEQAFGVILRELARNS